MAPPPFEEFPELVRRAIGQRAVGPLVVVLVTPGGQSTPDIIERPEPGCVEAFIAQPAVEALYVAVLHRAAWLDVDQTDFEVLGPADHPA